MDLNDLPLLSVTCPARGFGLMRNQIESFAGTLAPSSVVSCQLELVWILPLRPIPGDFGLWARRGLLTAAEVI